MKLIIRVTLLVVLLAFGAWALVAVLSQFQHSDVSAQEKKNIEAKEDVRKIPLAAVFATGDQDGLTYVAREKYLSEIYVKTSGFDASNVFLVRGQNVNEALYHTKSIFTDGRRADRPAGLTGEFWLVAYFGVAPSGDEWIVNSVEKKGTTLRLDYETPEREMRPRNRHQYFAWVPLGHLDAGTYNLELFDAKAKQVTVMRRVVVPK